MSVMTVPRKDQMKGREEEPGPHVGKAPRGPGQSRTTGYLTGVYFGFSQLPQTHG